jgi:hypothetical protein
MRRLAVLLLLLAGCEDNEHPFGDTWSMSCGAEGAPPMMASFNTPTRLDDSGNRREYLGRVDVSGPAMNFTWLWDVTVDLKEGAAETQSLTLVPTPDEYVASGELKTLTLDVRTYSEADDTQSAHMEGDARGPLVMDQFDDCDLCPDCSTLTVLPAGGGAAFLVLALMRRRRR